MDTIPAYIDVTPGVADGKPHIAGHRITVQTIVGWHEWLGLRADEIASVYDLTLGNVYAALAYYYDHQEEIDLAMRTDDALVGDVHRRTLSRLRSELGD